MLVEIAQAQTLFDALPDALRWPSLSPSYVAADARRDAGLRPLFMVARQGGGLLMHAVHEADIPGAAGRDWQSPYGYGGPLATGLDVAGLASAWRTLDGHAAERDVIVEFVRFHPVLGNERYYGGTVRAERSVVAVDLRVPDLLASYSGRARTAIRKAERAGLSARWETATETRALFPPFYRQSMAQIGAGAFYAFGDAYFDALLALPGARVLSVMRGNERLSMGLFLFGPTQVEYHLSGTTPEGRASSATNLLLHAAAVEAQSTGRVWLYLGGGTSARSDDPLLRFKESLAQPGFEFCIGHRIFDQRAYQRLREAEPERAAASTRVLFYRR